MSLKKERKLIKREGNSTSSTEAHRIADLESCQKLLELGCVGSRIYNGPNLSGSFLTHQDKLLNEMKWVAMDVYENRKLAVASCRLISKMVKKYWSERRRGSLSSAASMVKGYWLSIANEIHMHGHSGGASCSIPSDHLFKFNTFQPLRGGGNAHSSLQYSSSTNLSTPTNASGAATPCEEMGGGLNPTQKKLLAHGQAHEWMESHQKALPPVADGTTTMADFCVQVLKHHVKSDSANSSVVSPHRSSVAIDGTPRMLDSLSPLALEKPISESEVLLDLLEDAFLVPIDSFVTQQDDNWSNFSLIALRNEIELNKSKNGGVDVVPCLKSMLGDINFFSNNQALVNPESVECQKTLLEEILCTNVMSQHPHLFSTVTGAERLLKLVAPSGKQGVGGISGSGGVISSNSKHYYFVSVLYSSFVPVVWDEAELEILSACVGDVVRWSSSPTIENSHHQSAVPIDWSLIASCVNWRMRSVLGYDLLRTAAQCEQRWNDHLVSGVAKKKRSSSDLGATAPLLVRRRWQQCRNSVKRINAASKPPSTQIIDFPIQSLKNYSILPLDKRGVFSGTTAKKMQAFYAASCAEKHHVTLRGVCAVDTLDIAGPVMYQLGNSAVGGSSKQPLAKTTLTANSTHAPVPVISRRNKELEQTTSNIQALLHQRAAVGTIPRAFALEDIIRKNGSVSNGQVLACLSGSAVCLPHPSFSNLNKIAEVTLNRLINSINNGMATAGGVVHPVNTASPISINQLYEYCALFRKKYPAIFVTQQKSQKPQMPQPRNSYAPRAQPIGANNIITNTSTAHPVRQGLVAAQGNAARPQISAPEMAAAMIIDKEKSDPGGNIPPVSPDHVKIETSTTNMNATTPAAAVGPAPAWIRSSQRQTQRKGTRSAGEHKHLSPIEDSDMGLTAPEGNPTPTYGGSSRKHK